jgi:starch phosphorylase
MRRDRREADATFALLEREIAPLFHDRPDGVPRRWVERVATNWSTLGWNVTAARMVREYVTELYEPAAAAATASAADDGAAARALTAWSQHVRDAWDDVHVEIDPASDLGEGLVGEQRSVDVRVDPGGLDPDELAVQLVYGPLAADGDFDEGRTTIVDLTASAAGRYTATFATPTPGPWGVTARALPRHDGLSSLYETGLVASG